MEPIAELMDDHLEMLDLAGVIRSRLSSSDRAGARDALGELASRLAPHVRREERGVFAALKQQGEFVDEVLNLESEHVALDAALDGLDPGAPDFEERVESLLADLSVHIDRENLGIFPLTVVSLNAVGWDLVTRAHAEEGPVHAAAT